MSTDPSMFTQQNPTQPLYSTYQLPGSGNKPLSGIGPILPPIPTSGLGNVDFSKTFPAGPSEIFDSSMMAKMDPKLQAIFMNSNLKGNMAPFGLNSAFLQHPFINFANNYQHVDQPHSVMNREGVRPKNTLFATSDYPQGPPPKNLNIVSEVPLSNPGVNHF